MRVLTRLAPYSGKSSFILTILHLLEYSGTVTIDGIDTSGITRQQLRSRITVLSQDPIELQGSARHNMASFTSADLPADDEIQGSLAQVGLWDHVSSKGGLDSEYSALGLSQGQRQLFCLARAVLHQRKLRSKIVLVDEATSNVDGDTDKKMQAVMRAAFLECTVITVAHRLDTIQDVDVVLEFDSGRLVRQEHRAGVSRA